MFMLLLIMLSLIPFSYTFFDNYNSFINNTFLSYVKYLLLNYSFFYLSLLSILNELYPKYYKTDSLFILLFCIYLNNDDIKLVLDIFCNEK